MMLQTRTTRSLLSTALLCAAISLAGSIAPAPAAEASDMATGKVVMGVHEITAGGQTFRFINGRNARIAITADGRVKLHYLETQPSSNGKNGTKAWVMNSYMVPLKPAELKSMSSSGLRLPEGNHTFYVYYVNPDMATTPAQLREQWWEIMGNEETYRNHTAAAEYAILEVTDVRPRATNEIRQPRDIRAATWYPQYQETPHNLDLPPGKVLGITKRVHGISAARLVEQGQYIQSAYADVNNGGVPYNRTWTTHRAYVRGTARIPYDGTLAAGSSVVLKQEGLTCRPGDIISLHKGYSTGLPKGIEASYGIPAEGVFRVELCNTGNSDVTLAGGAFQAGYFGSVEEEAERLYQFSSRKGNVAAAEICENGIPYEFVEPIYRRLYELQVARDGVTGPNDTDLIADYFSHLYGYGTELGYWTKFAERRELFANPEVARKSTLDGEPSQYYAKRAYEYRHRIVGGYLDGMSRVLDGLRLYRHIANLERQYIAMPDRRVATFGWTAFEGVDSRIERNATWQRLPMKGGDLLRVSRMEGSFEQLKFEAFISLLIGDYYISWNDNAMLGTNIERFGLAHIGGAAPSKNAWQPVGGEIVQYDPDNPAHPRSAEGEGPGWSDGAAPGHNGGFVGAWLLSQIRDRIDRSLCYAAFRYSVSGEEQPGYCDGSEPIKGALGNAEVSRFGRGNAGQANIVNQEEHRKPIVLFGEGSKGCCAIVLNPFAGLTGTTTYRLGAGKGHVVQHTGPYLGVYRLAPSAALARD
jgi:hypothetical protein